ncbi:ester cyclase [Salinimicrobium sp. TH3]|uniref:ester cyclase n=1 Tax=Salinimicrobium sp. TH3 TaxID=2997342 RepID=UPI002274C6E1|nr:ester cyclase [Salinimicrobium sp. TH3]MCY2686334.1 ester cyclase [Salinimicrobium sp. TH3]
MNQQEQNKRIVEAYVNAFNAGEMEKLAALFSPKAEIQGVLGKGLIDKVMPIWRQLVEGLGMQLKIEELCAEGDIVAARYTETGTFKGPFMGNEPTGKSYELVAMEWFTIKDDLIIRRWGARDGASQARQLGLPLK